LRIQSGIKKVERNEVQFTFLNHSVAAEKTSTNYVKAVTSLNMNQTPALELVRLLQNAYPKCSQFDGTCKKHGIECHPTSGHIPRGYAGAFGKLDDVKLVLILAEPGGPGTSESYDISTSRPRLVREIAAGVACTIRAPGGSAFHVNLQTILNKCWPGLSFEEQMKRTWITESVLCSAKVSAGPLKKDVAKACAETYLQRQLALFPGRFVACLGGKAEQRMKWAGLPYNFKAGAPGLPGGNFKSSKESWAKLGKQFQRYLRGNPATV
jgi:hypothetical protein